MLNVSLYLYTFKISNRLYLIFSSCFCILYLPCVLLILIYVNLFFGYFLMIWDFLLFGINQFVSIGNIIDISVKNVGEKSE